MPGTVALAKGQLLVFRFPYSPEVNRALRDATDNRVRWDPQLRGFTLSAARLGSNPGLVANVTRFIVEQRLDADAAIRKLLVFRTVKATGLSRRISSPGARQAPDELGPGRVKVRPAACLDVGFEPARACFPAETGIPCASPCAQPPATFVRSAARKFEHGRRPSSGVPTATNCGPSSTAMAATSNVLTGSSRCARTATALST